MTENVPVAENYAITKMRVQDTTYMWTVENFSYYSNQTGSKLYSPMFTVGGDANLKWRLDLFPMGFRKPKWISLYLCLKKTYHSITAEFRFSILNKRGEPAYQSPWSPKHTFCEYDVWGFEEFILRRDLFRDADILLPGDKLTIYCEVKASMGYQITKTETTKEQSKTYNSEHEVCNDFQWLYQTGKLSDITLLLNGMPFFGHKCVLASRSSVFQQLFEEHSQMGNELHLISLSEFQMKVMMEVLRYMYTGTIMNLNLMGIDILAAAIRYDLQGLKLICEEYLIHNLNINNAWNLLIIAEQHQATKLKFYAIKFITDHASGMIDSPGYHLTQNSYPHLVTEVTNSIVNSATKYVPPGKGKKRKHSECISDDDSIHGVKNYWITMKNKISSLIMRLYKKRKVT